MKIYIGPYISHWGTYSIEYVWYKWRHGKSSLHVDESEYDRWDRGFEKVMDLLQNLLNATVNKIQNKRKRKVRVKVEYYDTWSADRTLALVILPTLERLKQDAHGAPITENEDVPEHLRFTEPAGPDNGYVDNTMFERWDWILDEMIWTFRQLADEDSEDQFYEYANAEMMAGQVKVDHDGLKLYNDRIANGLRLFGKYYRGLWN